MFAVTCSGSLILVRKDPAGCLDPVERYAEALDLTHVGFSWKAPGEGERLFRFDRLIGYRAGCNVGFEELCESVIGAVLLSGVGLGCAVCGAAPRCWNAVPPPGIDECFCVVAAGAR